MKELWYSDYEIVYDVQHALNPYQQVGILAELNGVSRKEIEKVLKRNGCKLPKPQRDYCHFAKRGRTITDIDRAEKRRADKRAYYLKNRERLIKQATAYQKKRRERLLYGEEQKTAPC